MLRGLAASVCVSALGARAAEAQVTGKQDDKLPAAFVDRSLVLPRLWLTSELDGSLSHLESEWGPAGSEDNGGWLDLGGAISVLDDLELEATVASINFGSIGISAIGSYRNISNSPFAEVDTAPVHWGMAKLGATFRFLAADEVEMGLRFRILVDREATVGLNGGLPVLLHGNRYARVDTGIAFVGRIPKQDGTFSDTGPSLGLVDVSRNPMAPDAGIPVRVALQPVEEVWFGLNTGIGAFDVTFDESLFVPVGASIGGTIALERVVFDLVAAFNFPALIRPVAAAQGENFYSELWQLGLAFKAHAGLL